MMNNFVILIQNIYIIELLKGNDVEIDPLYKFNSKDLNNISFFIKNQNIILNYLKIIIVLFFN